MIVERATKRGWKRLGTIRADASGIFRGAVRGKVGIAAFREPPLRLRSTASGCSGGKAWTKSVRARFGKAVSLSFSLAVPRDRAVLPFG